MAICGFTFWVVRAENLIADARGATAIEYALLAGGIALAIIAAVFALGATLQVNYEGFGAALN